MNQLVLSLFPGIGLLDRAFEEEGFTVVRGPDMIWGGDVKTFHVPEGRFDGIIGGPPCKAWSQLVHIVRHQGKTIAPDLIPEFARIVTEAQPTSFLMENVDRAPAPGIDGYLQTSTILNNRWLGEVQNRRRKFHFGTRRNLRLSIRLAALEHIDFSPAVLANGQVHASNHAKGGRTARLSTTRRNVRDALELQGLPKDFFATIEHELRAQIFTVEGKQTMIGNGVPLPMGRAIARAVKEALEL